MKHLMTFESFIDNTKLDLLNEGKITLTHAEESESLRENSIKYSSDDDFIAYHGSYNKIEDFNKFPLFVTTMQLRAQSFAIDMKWDEKRQKNVFRGAKLGDIGYVYKLLIKNAIIEKKNKDEILLNNANIEIIDTYMVKAVKNPLNPRNIKPEKI